MADFAKIRETLEQSRDRLLDDLDDGRREEILRRRTRELAEREDDDIEARDAYETVVVVARDRSTYGLPIEAVQEVRRVPVTRLPHATDVVQGLFHVRGHAHCLVDLAAFSGSVDRPRHGDSVLAAIVTHGRDTLGIRIDEVIRPRTIYTDELDDGASSDEGEIVAAITKDVVEIIDSRKLFDRSDIVLRV